MKTNERSAVEFEKERDGEKHAERDLYSGEYWVERKSSARVGGGTTCTRPRRLHTPFFWLGGYGLRTTRSLQASLSLHVGQNLSPPPR